jgi:hypothetical protein
LTAFGDTPVASWPPAILTAMLGHSFSVSAAFSDSEIADFSDGNFASSFFGRPTVSRRFSAAFSLATFS